MRISAECNAGGDHIHAAWDCNLCTVFLGATGALHAADIMFKMLSSLPASSADVIQIINTPMSRMHGCRLLGLGPGRASRAVHPRSGTTVKKLPCWLPADYTRFEYRCVCLHRCG